MERDNSMSMHTNIHTYMICMYACMYMHELICVYAHTYTYIYNMYVCIHTYIICMHACICTNYPHLPCMQYVNVHYAHLCTHILAECPSCFRSNENTKTSKYSKNDHVLLWVSSCGPLIRKHTNKQTNIHKNDHVLIWVSSFDQTITYKWAIWVLFF
jgi:hypothetical protein